MKGLSLSLSLTGGVSLGSEMVLNGTFSDGTSWSAATEGAISGGAWVWTSTTSTRTTTNTGTAPTAGRTYRVTFDVVSRTAGSVQVLIGGTAGTSRSAVGTYTEDLVATNTTKAQLRAANSTTATVDNISVKEIL